MAEQFSLEWMAEICRPHNDKIVAEYKLEQIRKAATRWPRCCDLWQDGLGGMHCTECAQKTFAMLKDIQIILGVDKAGEQKEDVQ